MSTVAEHYATLLAPIYLWMSGGFDAAISGGETEIDGIDLGSLSGRTAVDLGAGFGTHTIPLARRGCRVVATDTSPILLDVLRTHCRTLPVQVVEDDLLNFQKHLETKVDLILCMGDTLTHLPEPQCVEQLFSHAAQTLNRGGKVVASFRDYSAPLIEVARFIPVRSDDDRILMCFLEYFLDWVWVHDVVHERSGAGWQMRVSSYKKLRLSPDWVCAALQACGLAARTEPGLSGMVRVVAERV
jgi:2-polyprenyl-3-methyl-5-hydroxy-6-metoxy-1,4-benzoquinol methylase